MSRSNRNSRDSRASLRNNNAGGSRTSTSGSDFSYGNYSGIYNFNPNPIGNGSVNGSNRVVITNLNNGNNNYSQQKKRISVNSYSGTGSGNGNGYNQSLNMNSLQNNLPSVVQRNNVAINARLGVNPQRMSRNGGIGGASLHPNDLNMLQVISSLPTRFNMSHRHRSDTR